MAATVGVAVDVVEAAVVCGVFFSFRLSRKFVHSCFIIVRPLCSK